MSSYRAHQRPKKTIQNASIMVGHEFMTPELHQNMYQVRFVFMHQEEHTGSLRSHESLDSIS
jgi:hypothetical protein